MILPRDGLERENPFSFNREGFGSAPAASAAVDRRCSDYTLLDPLGSGLRGTVYRARAGEGRLVALKLFNRGVRIDLEALRRFSPEAERPIQHPNLVPVEAAGDEDGQAFCAMALLRGDSLDDILHELRGEGSRSPHLSPLGVGAGGKPRTGFIRQAVALLLGVAEGLDRAHRAGLVHGRLSPRNLIFTPAGQLVVTDFGSEGGSGARRVGSGVSHDLATLTYRAPEQIDPLPAAPDGRVDVYALGAILYQLLTRRPPFDGRNPQEIREAISEGRFDPPTAIEPLIGQEAEAVILQAMASRREDRYPGAGSLARDLRHLLRLEATEAWAEVLSLSPGAGLPRRAEAAVAAVPPVEGVPVEGAPAAEPAGDPLAEAPAAPVGSAVDGAATGSSVSSVEAAQAPAAASAPGSVLGAAEAIGVEDLPAPTASPVVPVFPASAPAAAPAASTAPSGRVTPAPAPTTLPAVPMPAPSATPESGTAPWSALHVPAPVSALAVPAAPSGRVTAAPASTIAAPAPASAAAEPTSPAGPAPVFPEASAPASTALPAVPVPAPSAAPESGTAPWSALHVPAPVTALEAPAAPSGRVTAAPASAFAEATSPAGPAPAFPAASAPASTALPAAPVPAPSAAPESGTAPWPHPPVTVTIAELVPAIFAPAARPPLPAPPVILELRPEPAETFPGEPVAEPAGERAVAEQAVAPPAVEAEPECEITEPCLSEPITPERGASSGSRRLRGVGVALAAMLVLGGIGIWTWLTLFLHDAGEKNRVRAEIFSLGLGHLQKAVLALFAEDREAAGSEVVATRRLGITDPLLARIEAELKRPVDPVLADLAHPRAPVRRQALAALEEELAGAARPAGDLLAATAALGDEDLSVREAAILLLAGGRSSAPLLEAYPIGAGLPPLTLDGPTFLALVEALSRIADGPALAALLAWSFEDFERLDSSGEEREALPPNLRIVPGTGVPGRFLREWIRSRGRLASAEVLSLARRAVGGEIRLVPLVDAIADGLVHLRGREAARALAALAAAFHVDHGPRLIEALSALGASEDLLELARAPLPDGLRAQAVRAAGRAVIAGGKGLGEVEAGLRGLVSADPSEEVRRLAFRTAVELSPRHGAALAAAALPDPALREEVLEFLARRPLPETLPVLLQHLRRGDPELRQRAARALGATGDPAALPALALLLFDEPAGVRAGALEAMREISTVRALPLLAGILSPRDPVLIELALEATRCPLEPGESPALRLLALREPLGLNGPADPPPALREARRALLRSGLPGAPGPSTGDWPARAEAVLSGLRSPR